MNRAEPHIRFANSSFAVRQAVLDHARKTGTSTDSLFAPATNSPSRKQQEEEAKEPDWMAVLDWLAIPAAIGVLAYLWRRGKPEPAPTPPSPVHADSAHASFTY
jgi:hypothetical protein